MKAFIEFGAYTYPNLLHYLDNGWYGIFVEPHPMHLIELVKYLQPYPQDTYTLLCGVVAESSDEYYVFQVPPNNDKTDFTQIADNSVAYRIGEEYPDIPKICFQPITLDTLIRKSPYPVERLEIDCEGCEYEIFNSYTFFHKPKEIKVALHNSFFSGREMLNAGDDTFLRNIFENHSYEVRRMDEEHLFATYTGEDV